MSTPPPRPLIGVALFLLSPTPTGVQFLLGERLSPHGLHTYALPGGHLEFSETFEECAVRELAEETSLSVSPDTVRFLTATNSVMPEGKHYVTIFMVASMTHGSGSQGEPRVMEPEKCRSWEWVGWEELVGMYEAEIHESAGIKGEEVKRLFQPMRDLLEQRPGVVPSLTMVG